MPQTRFGRALLASSALIAATVPGVLVTTAAHAQPTHVSNPYSGATVFIDPQYADEVESSYNSTVGSNPTLAAQMATAASYPTFHWLDSIETMNGTFGGLSLTQELNDALTEESGTTPIVWQGVVYDLPGRDCAALASNGEIPLTTAGLTEYEQDYINPMVTTLSSSAYDNIRFVLVIEPDSLPNMATNTGQSGGTNTAQSATALSSGLYEDAYEYAVQQLATLANVYEYLDIAHSAWLGWSNNASSTATIYTDMINGTNLTGSQTTPATKVSEGFAAVSGFVDDTANYTPLVEPYMTATESIGGNAVDSDSFYQFNPTIDENGFINEQRSDLSSDGWPISSLNWITDTGRSGWGATSASVPGNTASPINVRPTAASTSTTLATFVQDSKVDLRDFRGEWCNQADAGIGQPPLGAPSADYQAPSSVSGVTAPIQNFVWVKGPASLTAPARR